MGIRMILTDKKFRPLFWTQFLGALNDNLLKNALVVMVTFKGIAIAGLDAAAVVALSGALFILPFFVFSPVAGQFSDKLEKHILVRFTKIWELLIMVLASIGFYTQNFEVLLGVLFLAGMQATLFGPVKYSMLPELVESEDLVEANAFVELGTFLAILLGTIGGGLMVALPGSEHWLMGSLMTFSVLGLITSYQVPKSAAACPELKVKWNPIPGIIDSFKLLRQSEAIFNSVLGISWLWFFGAAVLSTLPLYCKDYLGVGETVVTLFLAMFTIGTGVGSIICEKLSFKRVEIGLVPLGSLGMTVFLVDLFFTRPTWVADPQNAMNISEFLSQPNGPRLLFDFFMMSAFGGIFILPLYTLLQERSASESRSRVIAGNNIANALFMVVSSLCVMAMHAYKFSYPQIFLTLGIANLAVAVYIYSIVPEFTLRFLSWVTARFLYRLKLEGEENIPKTGPVVLICNHVSFADWLVVSALIRRPVRFVMHYKFFNVPFVRYLMKQAKVIPIAGAKEDKALMEAAFEKISAELKAGEVICIFPEGKITRDGEISEFKTGIERIIERDKVPVVPMALVGLWDSFFGYGEGRALRKVPRKWLSRVRLLVSPAVAPELVTAELLNQKVKALVDSGRDLA